MATKKGKKTTGTTTWSLTECAIAYLESLKTARKSESTIAAYSSDLDLAVAVFGSDKPIAEIGIDEINAFNQSDPVMKTKTGRDKSLPTIERSRRVLRLALCHAEREGVIESAPFEARKRETKDEPAPAATTPEPATKPKGKRTKKSTATTPEPGVGSEEWKQAQRELPLHQREAIGLDDQRDKPAADPSDPAQISYASTGEAASA